MIYQRLGFAACLLVVMGITACVSSDAPGVKAGTPVSAREVPGSVSRGFPNFPEVVRASAGASDDFLIRQNGADFAQDLPYNRAIPDGDNAHLSPAWSSTGPDPLVNATYCIYRLTYDPQAAPVTLSLDWNSPSPAEVDCWIGLSYWAGGAWQWQTMPIGGQLEVASPENFVDAQQQCFVAVVVLGETPRSLTTIGFGIPVVPPTGDGDTLVAPLNDTSTYVIDMDGNVVHTWDSPYTAGAAAELKENGNLLREANIHNPIFTGGGTGGRLEEYDWSGNLVWFYELSSAVQCAHHSFTRLPNGNILLVAWDLVSDADVLGAGRDPASLKPGTFWGDSIVEIEPLQPSGGTVVWEWHSMDHLIQDFDGAKANYGDPAAHPELLDINFPPQKAGDWIHLNRVSYNFHLDQVMVSTPFFSELWIIDHSTTTAEARGHSGGRRGHGGDLLYRWGNTQSYRGGDVSDEQLFGCHDAHWIEDGLDGAGNILVFNNNQGKSVGLMYSSVLQIAAPLNPDGTYFMTGQVYGPLTPDWEYVGTPPESFYGANMSSAQRLPGGDTLVCSGPTGSIFVVDPLGTTKWEYHNAFPSEFAPQVFRALRYPLDYPGLADLS